MRKFRIPALLTALCLLLTALPFPALAAEDVTGAWTLDELLFDGTWYSAALLKLMGFEINMGMTFNADGTGVATADGDSVAFEWVQCGSTVMIGGGVATLEDGRLTLVDGDEGYRFRRADGTAETPKAADAPAPTAPPTAPSAPSSLGKTVTTADGVRITPISIRESDSDALIRPESGNIFVLVEFSVSNGSASEVTFSSTLSFTVVNGGEEQFGSFAAVLTSDASLDTTLPRGGRATGFVGFEVSRDWQTLEIHYRPLVGDAEDCVFTLNRSDLTP